MKAGTKIWIIALLTLFGTTSFAQQLTPSVIASAGIQSQSGNKRLSYTIGQLVTPSFRNNKILSQGFQQANPIITGKINKTKQTIIQNIEVRLFPNPTTDRVTVTIQNSSEEYHAQVFDMMGRQTPVPIQYESTGSGYQIRIDMEQLSPGQYYVRIRPDQTHEKIADLKIIKN